MNARTPYPSFHAPIPAASFTHILLLAGIVAAGPALWADFIQPVAVTVSNGEALQDKLIDGYGFDDSTLGSPQSVHVAAASEMWDSIGSIHAELVFDLGAQMDLTKVYLWNYNAGADTDHGMKDVLLFTSSDTDPATAKFTGIALFSLTEGGDTAQAFDLVGTEVRLVKLRNTSNWGNGYAVGLAEVRFESGDIAGSVPTVAINGLKDGDVVPYGSQIALSATVADKDFNIAKVEFFDGSTKLDEKTKTPFTTSLGALTKGDHALRVVATDATGKVGWALVNVVVRDVVPGTIIQIDDQRDIGTQTNQIRYVNNWTLAQGNDNDPRFLHNDHYTDVGGSYFEVRFVGVKIDVFATVASHHGTGSATIDGGTKYTLNYKAAQRAEQVLIWSSPLLPNREHTLRITVLGTGVVTADRFDVTQSDAPSDDRASVKKWDVGLNALTIEMEDLGTSKVDTNTVALKVDGGTVPVQVSKAGTTTTIVYTPPAAFLPGSQHPFKVEAKDGLGNAVGGDAVFIVPSPPFPLTGLGEPPGEAGLWNVRQVWNAGRADAVVTAVGIAQSVGTPGFAGNVFDAKSPVINFAFTPSPGGGGLMVDDLPFPAESEGLVASDWITVARARVHIPTSGDWTLGVHSDDGFELRFIGHPFNSVSGNGSLDEDFPEYVGFAVGTGDSNTRAVLKGITAGDYGIEFIHFQRTGGANAEIYAAEGEFVDDGDTETWTLIGDPAGLQLVADEVILTPITLGQLQFSGAGLTLDFVSPKPTGQHALLESADLKAWQPVAGAVFTATGGNGVRATVNNPTGDVKLYRVSLTP